MVYIKNKFSCGKSIFVTRPTSDVNAILDGPRTNCPQDEGFGRIDKQKNILNIRQTNVYIEQGQIVHRTL